MEAFSCIEIVCLTLFKNFWGAILHKPEQAPAVKSELKKNKTEINQSSQSGHYNHLLIQSLCKQRTFQSLLNTRKRMAFELDVRPLFNYSWTFFPIRFNCSIFSTIYFVANLLFGFNFLHEFSVFHPSIVHSRKVRIEWRNEKCLTANEWALRSYQEFVFLCFVFYIGWELGSKALIR